VSLPPHLAERVEPGAPAPRAEGEFVIYWMRVAMRAEENPALEVALAAARALKKPVFVYQGLTARHRYASDRLHTFILEGAREVQRALEARGVGAVFHLERGAPPGRGRRGALVTLAQRAALVVTDFMPTRPMLGWDEALAKVVPLWRVDASCVAPVWLLEQRFERAKDFAAQAHALQVVRATRALPPEKAPPRFLPELPFAPVDLAHDDLAALVASCEVDHTVAPVHHTPGGGAAGLGRWRRFHDAGLADYHLARADPLREGTARISAYLHFGMLSPFLVARECLAQRTDGAERFLDELLTWRELAWNFCRMHGDVEADLFGALPGWARATLTVHERDRRPALPSWEQLARAQTGEPLWDACQRALLAHGALHGALRMTWGKAVLQWTRTAGEALPLLLELNNRYALDGRDPSSVAGVLWCAGSMDRPINPEVPVLGAVRPRPLAEQALRLDVGEYARRARRTARRTTLTVAVVGGGVAGLACARAVSDAGHAVTVFDAGGGRVATRRESVPGRPGDQPAEHGGVRTASHERDARFDHGAQYFTVRDERFARWVRAWWHERVVAEWKPRLMTFGERARPERPVEEDVARLVAVPGMGALVERLAQDLDVRRGVRVAALSRAGGRWRLKDPQGEALGEFDAAVVATPAPIAAELVDPASYALASRVREARLAPCLAVLVELPQPLDLELDAAFVNVGPLSWLARESSKPERPPAERWVLHASAEWSERHAGDAPEAVSATLLDAFFATTGASPVEPELTAVHVWRHALVTKPLGEPCLFDAALRLAVCGDWCLDGRVEAAFLSGSAAAGRINALPAAEEPPAPSRDPAQMKLI